MLQFPAERVREVPIDVKMVEDVKTGSADASHTSNGHTSQSNEQAEILAHAQPVVQTLPVKETAQPQIVKVGRVPKVRGRGARKQLLKEKPKLPKRVNKAEEKKQQGTQHLFDIDEQTLKKIEEESEYLDSMIEISERMFQTQRENCEKERQKNSLLTNLLEPDQEVAPFNFDSF